MSEVNALRSFVFLAVLSWMQLPLAAVDSWIPWDDPKQCQVNCLLQPQAATPGTLTHTYKHRDGARAKALTSTQTISVIVSLSVTVSVIKSVHIKTIYIPSPSLLLWRLNSLSLWVDLFLSVVVLIGFCLCIFIILCH